MQQRFLLAPLALLAFDAGSAIAQVAARQGVAPPPAIVNFDSPMILDLPLPNVATLDSDVQLQLPSVRKYICDSHVQLLNLAIAKEYKGPKKSRSLALVLLGAVFVADSYDRRFDLALRVKSGNDVLAAQTLRNQSAEEQRIMPFRILLPIAESRLISAYSAEPPPVLELTLTVRDDS